MIVTRESVAKVAKWEFTRVIKAFASFSYLGQAGSLALNLDFLVSETLLLGIIHASTGGAAYGWSFPTLHRLRRYNICSTQGTV